MISKVFAGLSRQWLGGLALLVAVGGVASAATGKPFVLGESNVASKTTTLQSTGSGAALKLKPAAGQPALAVANKILIRRLNASLLRGKAPRDFAPASGSKHYAPASGSPNYAPASGSANYAPSSGSPNYLSSSAPQLIYSNLVSANVDGATTQSNLVNVSLTSPGTGTLTMVFVGACSVTTGAPLASVGYTFGNSAGSEGWGTNRECSLESVTGALAGQVAALTIDLSLGGATTASISGAILVTFQPN